MYERCCFGLWFNILFSWFIFIYSKVFWSISMCFNQLQCWFLYTFTKMFQSGPCIALKVKVFWIGNQKLISYGSQAGQMPKNQSIQANLISKFPFFLIFYYFTSLLHTSGLGNALHTYFGGYKSQMWDSMKWSENVTSRPPEFGQEIRQAMF